MSDEHKPIGGCAICGKPKDERFKPFCSKRCADIDLGRWFSGKYAIPGDGEGDPDDEQPGETKA